MHELPWITILGSRVRRFANYFLTSDEVTSENHWQIASRVTPKSLVTVTHVLLYPRPTKLEWGYTGFTLSGRLSVRPSVRPSVCRRHGFWSISQVSFGIFNFICLLMVAIRRSLLIFRDVTFKMAAWRPYWISLFPNFTLALNINIKLQQHNTYIYG